MGLKTVARRKESGTPLSAGGCRNQPDDGGFFLADSNKKSAEVYSEFRSS